LLYSVHRARHASDRQEIEMTEQPSASVLVEQSDSTMVITLNRPDAMNAVDSTVASLVGAALAEAQGSSNVRAVVIIGTGRAFCAGMDLKAYARGEDVSAPGHADWGFAGLTQHPLDKPLIAAVNGFALGGGLEIVLAADLAVAAEGARLGLSEVKRGLIAGGGGVFRLPRLVPRRVAAEMILTGEPIDAAAALRFGLVNRVVEADQLMDEAVRLADRIAANGPLAVQASKRLMRDSFRFGSDWDDEIWQANDRVVAEILGSTDGKEGARAFAEHRTPVWTGH
jgi:crotonobetainyl-CoA hydratase